MAERGARQLVLVLVAVALSSCMPDLDRELPCADLGPRPDRSFSDGPTVDLVPRDSGPDQRRCTTDTDCDDGAACTGDLCQAGTCANTLQAGYCLIAGACVAAGSLQGTDPCVTCDPTKSGSDWTRLPCVSTLAGDGVHGDDDGAATSASFRNPTDVAIDAAGQVYVADSDNHRIRAIAAGQVSTHAGSNAGNLDGTLAAARFNKPLGVWIDGQARLLVADRGNNLIRLVSGGTVSTLQSGTDLVGPGGGWTLGSGEILVADTFHHRIGKMPAGGGAVSTMAGVTNKAGHQDGAASSALFFYPMSLVVDSKGTIYVVDTFTHTVRSISGGTVATVAGTPSQEGFADGPASSAKFRFPRGIAIDAQDTLFVSDTQNHRVRMIKGGQVTTLAGSGKQGFKDGLAAAAELDWPWGLEVDGSGKVYIADSGNDRVRIITP